MRAHRIYRIPSASAPLHQRKHQKNNDCYPYAHENFLLRCDGSVFTSVWQRTQREPTPGMIRELGLASGMPNAIPAHNQGLPKGLSW